MVLERALAPETGLAASSAATRPRSPHGCEATAVSAMALATIIATSTQVVITDPDWDRRRPGCG